MTFAAGEISQTVTVLVYGDQVIEYNEQFALQLSNGNQAWGTILNDDGVLVNIGDSSVYEGDYGTTLIGFTVWLSAPSTETVTVDFHTIDGTATAGSDYLPTNGTLTFAPGETSKTIWVEIQGDTVYEWDEYFYVVLENSSSNSLIQQAWGTGSILNNDPDYSDWWW